MASNLTRFIVIVDINGDNKADILYVNNFGTVTTFINQRGGDKSLKPFWRTAGVTHPGMGMDIGDPIVSIIFGRIYTDYHTDVRATSSQVSSSC